jgi:hypothetical protein
LAYWQRFSTTRVETAFRPLLDEIDFPNLHLGSIHLRVYKNLEQYLPLLNGKKVRLVIAARNTLKNDEAYTVFKDEKDGVIYTIIISLSEDLFNGSTYDDPMIRNIVGIHEFLHCISAFFSIPELNNNKRVNFIKECKTKMTLDILADTLSIDKIKSTNKMGSQDELFTRADDYFFPNTVFFADDHFRLSLDRTPLKYHNLYERFLLPRESFENYFTKSELRDLKALVGKNSLFNAYMVAQDKINAISENMHLEIDFVARRMKEILLSYSL